MKVAFQDDIPFLYPKGKGLCTRLKFVSECGFSSKRKQIHFYAAAAGKRIDEMATILYLNAIVRQKDSKSITWLRFNYVTINCVYAMREYI